MPEYLSPGVYVEEVSTGPRPIEGVSTSTAGFVGMAERGPLKPRLITSWQDYTRWFGTYFEDLRPGSKAQQTSDKFLPYAVRGFFDNGGKRLFVARVIGKDAKTAAKTIGGFAVEAIGPGEWGNNILVKIGKASLAIDDNPLTKDWFKIQVAYYRVVKEGDKLLDPDPKLKRDPKKDRTKLEPTVVEVFDNLSPVQRDTSFAETVVNAQSRLVRVSGVTAKPDPVDPTALEGGEHVDAELEDYRGANVDESKERGLASLQRIDEIALLASPSVKDITGDLIGQCEELKDRFTVVNGPASAPDLQELRPPIDTTYGAVYFPWVRVLAPHTPDGDVLVPPCGHVTGVIARVDVERGVHKAPANEVVRGITLRDLGPDRKPLQTTLGKREQDILNPRGVNVIRDFRADRRGIRVWGARTMSSDPIWKYVSVRRLFIFIEESIDEGTQWVVFEPNYELTWQAVRVSVSGFLRTLWRNGALAGTTPDEAFFVKCDRTTMTQDDIDNGRLICLVGIAPVKPAEFVIFRVSQKTIETQA